jgi:hypothetical protein
MSSVFCAFNGSEQLTITFPARYRASCTVIVDTALSMSRRSSAVSSMAVAPMFSSRRCSFVVLGIGTIQGFWASSQASAIWAERYEADPELLERRRDFLLGLAPPQRVFALQGSDWLDRVGAADRLRTCFR